MAQPGTPGVKGRRAPRGRRPSLVGALVATLAVAGCGTATAAGSHGGGATAGSSTPPPAGFPSGKPTPRSGAASPAPTSRVVLSAVARMVCGEEIRDDIRQAFALAAPPRASSRWKAPLFRCDYPVDGGRLTITVSEDGTHPGALRRFSQLRDASPGARTITGLPAFGLPAFETPAGVVTFAKDDKTLTVDARALPEGAGPSRQSRAGDAYQIAADILGCWKEH